MTTRESDKGLIIETTTEVKPERVPLVSDSTSDMDTRITKLELPLKDVATAPTDKPQALATQFRVYKNGATYRLYVYFPDDGSWKYATLT